MTQLVRHLMSRNLITCPPETTLGQAAVLLTRHHIHALVVSDANNKPLGIISDIDLLTGEWLSADQASLEAMQRMTVGQLMSSPPAAIEADAPIRQAAARMRIEHLHRLLVTEAGQAVGVISVSDLVTSLSHTSTERRTVADVMSRGIVICLDDTPLTAVARAMTERRSRSVVVVSPAGQPLGVVTGLDLLAYSENGPADPQAASQLPVSQIMRSPRTIAPTATLQEAANLMIQHHIHRLLVVDPNRPETMPLGLISTSDIIAEMAEPGSVWQTEAI